MHAIWDIPELMIQAGAWPMAPGLGREWRVPGPAAHDGLRDCPAPPETSAASVDLVCAMLEQMKSYPAKGGPETMNLERFWHPKMSWYGPAGIGSNRGFDGFLRGHMKPWVDGMPDWSEQDFDGLCHFFGDSDGHPLPGLLARRPRPYSRELGDGRSAGHVSTDRRWRDGPNESLHVVIRD